MIVAACEPLVTHCFVPLSRPSLARVRSAPASEPEPGSVSAKAPISSPARERRDPALAAVGEQRQRARARVHGDRDADAGVGARQLLEHEHVGEEVGAGAAVLLRDADAHQAEVAEVGEQRARERVLAVPLGGVRRDPLGGEARREVADLALLGGQLVQAHRRRSGITLPAGAAGSSGG